MKKLLHVSTVLFLFILSSIITAQAPSGYTSVLNHNFGSSGTIKNVSDLQNNYDWGLLWGDVNPNNPWANAAEWQKYTTLSSNNYAFASNHLKIIARFNNDINGNGTPDYAGGSDQTGTDREITSGCLRSKNTYKPTSTTSYYFETRMKVPSGKALWPAFWLYRKKGGTNAEIDIVEIVNNQWDSSKEPNWNPLVYHNNVHFSSSGDNAYASAKGSSLSTGYHIWACEWTDTQVKFYLDNNLIRTVSYPINDPNTGWGNSNPANVLINLAAGGGWPGDADDTNAFPATLEVDYLKVYEKTAGGSATLSAADVSSGQDVIVNFSGTPGFGRDWIGIYTEGAADNAYSYWFYTNGTKTPGTGITSGSVNFGNIPANNWECRYFENDGWNKIATDAFSVTSNGSVSAADVSSGQDVIVNFSGTPGYDRDWIGIYTEGAADNAYSYWFYTNGTKTPGNGTANGSVTFSGIPDGNWDCRYFENDGWNKIATDAFSVNGSSSSGYRYLKYTVNDAFNHKMIELSWLAGSTNYPQSNLTSNTSESGVTVSGSFGSDSYKAFDGDLSGPNGLWIGDQTPKHILLDFGSAKISPTKINIQKKSWSDLRGFKCEGSNDGSNWTLLLNNTTSAGEWTNKTYTFTAAKSALSSTDTKAILNESFVYPNPSKGLFNFNFSSAFKGEVSIELFSIDGRQIESINLQKANKNFTHQINISSKASGIYFINFEAGAYQSNHKIIKN